MKHSIRDEFHWVLIFVASLWIVRLIDFVLPIDFNAFGIRPRELWGLIGIPLTPFLHGGWGHLLGNTIPLIILLMLLAGSQANSVQIVVGLVLLGGGFLWLGGRSVVHVGASGLVYGLIAFLIASGFFERRPIPLLISVLVLFFYGGTMLWGILPSMNQGVSWDGHLYSAVAGGVLAYVLSQPTHDLPSIEAGSTDGR